MRRRLSYWLPVVLLVLCQSLLLLHQADLDAHSHGDTCSLCLVAHGVDSALPSTVAVAYSGPVSAVPTTASDTNQATSRCGIYFARAPPLSAHSVQVPVP